MMVRKPFYIGHGFLSVSDNANVRPDPPAYLLNIYKNYVSSFLTETANEYID